MRSVRKILSFGSNGITSMISHSIATRLIAAFSLIFILVGGQTALAEDASLKRLTVFTGTCRLQIVSGFFPCDPKVSYVELTNGRAFLTFSEKNTSFSVTGGTDRQPNLEDFYQGVDTLRMSAEGKEDAVDQGMEGECHFKLNRAATKFYFIKCDIYNRSKGSKYNFYLENITGFSKEDKNL